LRRQDFADIALGNRFDPLEDFYMFCMMVLGSFWNQHLDVLGPLFAPGVLGMIEESITETKGDGEPPTADPPKVDPGSK
jgi:hypothetical protein